MTNINLEYLVNSVQERFDDFAAYESKPKGYFNYSEKGEKEYRYYERAIYHGTNYIYDLCQLLNIDINNLYSLVKSIRKWNERTNWKNCFDFNLHEEKIINYLQH